MFNQYIRVWSSGVRLLLAMQGIFIRIHTYYVVIKIIIIITTLIKKKIGTLKKRRARIIKRIMTNIYDFKDPMTLVPCPSDLNGSPLVSISRRS